MGNPDSLEIIDSAFGQLPRGRISCEPGGTSLTDCFRSLVVESNFEFVPSQFYPRGAVFLRELLYPSVERSTSGLSVKDPVSLNVFGARNLLNLSNFALSPRQTDTVTLNLGISTDLTPIQPTFLSYIELGLQRLEGLQQIMQDRMRIKLRIFSTASSLPKISPRYNLDEIQALQIEQRDLIAAFLPLFHPNIDSNSVDLSGISMNIPNFTDDELASLLLKISHLPSEHLDMLSTASKKYGGPNVSADAGNIYGAYHTHPLTFQDGTSNHSVSIGGPSEFVFNSLRWAVNPGLKSIGLVVQHSVLATPPYLKSTGKGSERSWCLSLSDFTKAKPDLINASGRPHVFRDLSFLMRAMAHSQPDLSSDRATDIDRISALQNFYKSLGYGT